MKLIGIDLTVYSNKMVQNWIKEYIVMYLNKPNEVTSAHRPSRIKCLTHEIF